MPTFLLFLCSIEPLFYAASHSGSSPLKGYVWQVYCLLETPCWKVYVKKRATCGNSVSEGHCPSPWWTPPHCALALHCQPTFVTPTVPWTDPSQVAATYALCLHSLWHCCVLGLWLLLTPGHQCVTTALWGSGFQVWAWQGKERQGIGSI